VALDAAGASETIPPALFVDAGASVVVFEGPATLVPVLVAAVVAADVELTTLVACELTAGSIGAVRLGGRRGEERRGRQRDRVAAVSASPAW
jgi:hypothetical protein